jgi:nitroreductase
MSSRKPDHPVDPQFPERWSPRAYTGEPMPRETLFTMLEAARWAPSSFNSQPWRFIYALTDTPAFALMLGTLNPLNQRWAARASALVLLVSRTRWVAPGATQESALGAHAFDTGAAWMSFALQARAMGWHTHAIGGYDREALRGALAVPEDHALHAVVAVGRQGPRDGLPADLQAREQPNDRRPLAQSVAEGCFSFSP